MYKTIEAYYENGKIIYKKEDMPPLKRARLFITIVEEEQTKIHHLSRFKGIFKKKIDGLKYQEKIRNEWS